MNRVDPIGEEWSIIMTIIQQIWLKQANFMCNGATRIVENTVQQLRGNADTSITTETYLPMIMDRWLPWDLLDEEQDSFKINYLSTEEV